MSVKLKPSKSMRCGSWMDVMGGGQIDRSEGEGIPEQGTKEFEDEVRFYFVNVWVGSGAEQEALGWCCRTAGLQEEM